ncbi:alpha/beta fold hydrolase [Schlegelella sp. S2-27]|uniref:Alpha/beta fold hydrolase n=1 Tax=Caldimonas mangrovi TaxID=2944811 RepID=A0ABT0YW42_9BURK|nr:alpha/beta fold hydrolase [Caldimonas mangrovi]MCM5682957.1 alpha/beta fold hydrolase [Caldimonas mangrovi]
MLDLLCLPCAGASATMYWRWRRWLPRWVNLVPVELPGRGARLDEPYAADFDGLVDQLCDELSERPPARSWALLGHSMGALLACGVARTLRVRGRALPQAIFVSGSAAPARRDPLRFVGKDDDGTLTADLHRQGGTPPEVFDSPELLRITLDTLAADYRVCASFAHRPCAPLPLTVHALGGLSDDIATEDVEAWQCEAAGGFSVRWFEGRHFFIREHEQQVVQHIVRCLQPLHEDSESLARA